MAPARLRAGTRAELRLPGGEDWSPEQSRLDDTAKAAMFVNLLTEDNLPSYHREIATRFGRDGAWGTWVGRWTAEENRHGVALRDYLVVTRGVDPVELERARMAYMTLGYDSGDKTPLEAVAYVSFQELATRVSHRNTGRPAWTRSPTSCWPASPPTRTCTWSSTGTWCRRRSTSTPTR